MGAGPCRGGVCDEHGRAVAAAGTVIGDERHVRVVVDENGIGHGPTPFGPAGRHGDHRLEVHPVTSVRGQAGGLRVGHRQHHRVVRQLVQRVDRPFEADVVRQEVAHQRTQAAGRREPHGACGDVTSLGGHHVEGVGPAMGQAAVDPPVSHGGERGILDGEVRGPHVHAAAVKGWRGHPSAGTAAPLENLDADAALPERLCTRCPGQSRSDDCDAC